MGKIGFAFLGHEPGSRGNVDRGREYVKPQEEDVGMIAHDGGMQKH